MGNQKFNFTAIKLCVVFIGVYALQVIYGFEPGFNAASSPPFKFFTSILGHSGPEHLFNNLFFIGLFGSIFERVSSSRTLIATFLVSALFANLSAFVFFPETFIIGASGGGMGILAALAVYRPNKIGLALGVPLPMWAALAVYVFINVAGLTAANNTAYEAHLLGVVVGAALGMYLRDSSPENENNGQEIEKEDWRERIKQWEEKWMV